MERSSENITARAAMYGLGLLLVVGFESVSTSAPISVNPITSLSSR